MEPPVQLLPRTISLARYNENLTNELARYVTGIHASRRQEFAALTKGAPNCPLNEKLALLPGRE